MRSCHALLLVLGSSAACLAAGPVKVTDLGSPINPYNGKRPLYLIVEAISETGHVQASVSEGDNHDKGTGVVYRNGVMETPTQKQGGASINSHGDYLTNGANLLGQHTYFSGGQVHYANGSVVPVPGIPGQFDFVSARSINDNGVIVGHFSRFWSNGDFSNGKPFYRRGDQLWSPAEFGLMYRVNNRGFALMTSEIGSGVWSPETGLLKIAQYSERIPYADRTDFNENNEVLVGYTPIPGSIPTVRIASPTSVRDIGIPAYQGIPFVEPNAAGFNNFGHVVFDWSVFDGERFVYSWFLHRDGKWTDLTDEILKVLPAGLALDRVADIDDSGRIYGTATMADGRKTLIRVDTVPEPTTLAALGLGALLLRRRRKQR